MTPNLLWSSCRAIVLPEADTQGRPCHHLSKPKHSVQVQKRPPASQGAGSTQLSAEPACAKTARDASHSTSHRKRTAQHQVTRTRTCRDGCGPNTRRHHPAAASIRSRQDDSVQSRTNPILGLPREAEGRGIPGGRTVAAGPCRSAQEKIHRSGHEACE